jgi:hypothetical protein
LHVERPRPSTTYFESIGLAKRRIGENMKPKSGLNGEAAALAKIAAMASF